MKILNLYIEIKHPELAERARLQTLLRTHGFSFVDATEYDSYTSGHCALSTLDAIANDLRGSQIASTLIQFKAEDFHYDLSQVTDKQKVAVGGCMRYSYYCYTYI